MPILIVQYDSSWPQAFEALCNAIWPAVRDIAISIEHVGSTSVPGLAAKPVIDIDIVVASEQVATGIARLKGIGYEHLGDLGIPQREAFRSPESSIRHHLYICTVGSTALRNHLAVRGHLRSNPSVAKAYGELKKELARIHAEDMDAYVEGKTGFLTELLRNEGFEETHLTEIGRVNQRSRGRTTAWT